MANPDLLAMHEDDFDLFAGMSDAEIEQFLLDSADDNVSTAPDIFAKSDTLSSPSNSDHDALLNADNSQSERKNNSNAVYTPVSYTHLTLPTILRV